MKILIIILAASLPAVVCGQTASVSGRVMNGASGAPISVERVTLMKPGQFGMETVASLEGVSEFMFRDIQPGAGIPHILRTTFEGVSYSENVAVTEAKTYSADVTVYPVTKKWSETHVRVPHMIVVREGDHIQIEQTIEFHNNGKSTYTGDSLRIAIPETAHNTSLTTSYQNGMALPALSAVNGQQYAIALPLRPGQSRLQLSYEMQYNAAGTTLRQPFYYDVADLNIFLSPRDMTLDSDGAVKVEDEELARNNFSVFQRKDLKSGQVLSLTLRGGSAGVRRDITDVVAEDNAAQRSVWILLPLTLGLLSFGLYIGLSKTSGQRERIIKEIAALDDTWSEKGMADETYRQKRSALKTELREYL